MVAGPSNNMDDNMDLDNNNSIDTNILVPLTPYVPHQLPATVAGTPDKLVVFINFPSNNMLIVSDVCWSGQDDAQLVGHLQRYPQMKPAHIYCLCGLDSPDVALYEISGLKTKMNQAWLSTSDELSTSISEWKLLNSCIEIFIEHKLATIEALARGADDDGEDAGGEENQPNSQPKKTKKKP
ncbi:hypothetical protein PHLCEN_2v7066 [Hermanssonia centrifuga]|uniref:Uncharacterized protein n=1 Tax=Hermanssonia centrifuga TaxID=98765 RepID=A0A2R6NXM5_9APHY|nr:hypothetical protein PHLCEN_2v7066 [Hermanssonia centrifuga]